MISIKNSNKGSLREVAVSSNLGGGTLTLGTSSADSLELALVYAVEGGYSKVLTMSTNEVTLERDPNYTLSIIKVVNDFKKFVRGVGVSTPLHDYSNIVHQEDELNNSAETPVADYSVEPEQVVELVEEDLTETPTDIIQPPEVVEGTKVPRTTKKSTKKK